MADRPTPFSAPMTRAALPHFAVEPHVPLRLAAAAALAFPDGSMTASGLRCERDRGRLEVEMIAGKEYTTLAAIERMRELCRVRPRESASGSAPKKYRAKAEPSARPNGLSKELANPSPQAAALGIAQALINSSRGSSPSTTNPHESNVLSPRFRSAT